ncbi:hypothetical protein [Clostridium thailandense]|uniref:hypothetical protein n=1 Tax=Clostridium thailandense TaxID=2794346 RepID=UPI003989922D
MGFIEKGIKVMLNELFKYLKKPELYAESSKEFWNDEHISKKLLEAHLDPNFEGASRSIVAQK